jgi:uncharacterized membrane protein (DUF2068 family)
MSTQYVERKQDKLLPWIAAERAFRAVVLVVVGIVLVTHPHANWANDISRFARHLGLDPNGSGMRKLIEKVRKIHAHQNTVFGLVALAYGALEGAEAYGLWRRRRWGEWLTVIATALLMIPEVWELTKSTTVLKVGALLVNIAVVLYLLWRLEVTPRSLRPSRTRSDP